MSRFQGRGSVERREYGGGRRDVKATRLNDEAAPFATRGTKVMRYQWAQLRRMEISK